MPRRRDKLVGGDMGSEHDELAILCCVRNSKTIVCQRTRQYIFIESVEQEELPPTIFIVALRETSKRLRTTDSYALTASAAKIGATVAYIFGA
jgi:hypothetical protein